MITRRGLQVGGLMLGAAMSSRPASAQGAGQAGVRPPRTVTIQFGTNRKRGGREDLFTSEFADSKPGSTYYATGTIVVNELNGVYHVDRDSLRLDSDPTPRDLAAIAADPRGGADRFARFAQEHGSEPGAAGAAARPGLVFLPGFWNSFVDSIESAARIALGYGFRGDVICFSWPSLNTFEGYCADREACRKSADAIAAALTHLFAGAGPNPSGRHLIAHSMGCYALGLGLNKIRSQAAQLLGRRHFEHALLMAADVSHDALNTDELGRVTELARTVSVYTNKRDFALFARQFQHNLTAALGLWGPYADPKLPDGVTWVNASSAARAEDPSWAGHSYFALSAMVANDARQVLAGEAPKDVKPRVEDGTGPYDNRRFTIGTYADPAPGAGAPEGVFQAAPPSIDPAATHIGCR